MDSISEFARRGQAAAAAERARKTDEIVSGIAAQILRVTPHASSRDVAGYVRARTTLAASTIRRSLRRLSLLDLAKRIER
jgi:hypothetical protein